MQRFIMAIGVLWVAGITGQVQAQTQNWCVPPDPDYCVTHTCGIGDGDCDPGQCDEGVCVNDVGAQHGLPAHYDVCEARTAGTPDPDYCVNNYCGIGEGDCDPGQCDEGICVNDVGADYGLPAHYDVCEAGPTGGGGSSSAEQQLRGLFGTWDFTLTSPGEPSLPRHYVVDTILKIDTDVVATGSDLVDASTAVILFVENFPYGGQEYAFALADVDQVQSGHVCVTYVFNQSGNHIAGLFEFVSADGLTLNDCNYQDILFTGTFTGTRR